MHVDFLYRALDELSKTDVEQVKTSVQITGWFRSRCPTLVSADSIPGSGTRSGLRLTSP